MVDLTAPEIKALLWSIHVIDAAYGKEAPEGTVIESAKHKLLDELGHGGCNGERHSLRAEVVVEGRRWDASH